MRRQPAHRHALNTRLQHHLVRARIASACGDRPAKFRHARADWTLLGEHRSQFGSIDLQTGMITLGTELARARQDAALAESVLWCHCRCGRLS